MTARFDAMVLRQDRLHIHAHATPREHMYAYVTTLAAAYMIYTDVHQVWQAAGAFGKFKPMSMIAAQCCMQSH